MKDSTNIVAAGALESIFKLLFKGLDKLFDEAAEYQNDMGVLKQVNKLTVTKDAKEYTITVKLAPVKDRENIFYVEIDDGGCPGVDFSEYNEKPIKLDKDNKEEFKKFIYSILSKAGADPTNDQGDSQSSSYDIECYKEAEYTDWFENGQEPSIIKVNVTETPVENKPGYVDLAIECNAVQLMYDDHEVVEENISDIKEEDVEDVISKILDDTGLVVVDESPGPESDDTLANSSNYIDVSVDYIKAANEIKLNSIYANYDLSKASGLLDSLLNDDEFTEQLNEGPQCWHIVDEGDDLDIGFIDDIDLSNVNTDINLQISQLCTMLDMYYVNMNAAQRLQVDQVLPMLQTLLTAFDNTNTTQ